MQVQELMCHTPLTCTPEDTLDVPAGLMWDHDVGCVMVVDRNGHALGVVTDRDICMAAYTTADRLQQLPVQRLLTRPLISCRPTDSIDTAERLMSEHQVRRLAVIDDFGGLVGVVSQNDLVREAVHESRSKRREITEHEVMRTLDAIGTPRGEGRILTAAS